MAIATITKLQIFPSEVRESGGREEHCAYAVSTARNDRTIVVAQSDSVDQAVENG